MRENPPPPPPPVAVCPSVGIVAWAFAGISFIGGVLSFFAYHHGFVDWSSVGWWFTAAWRVGVLAALLDIRHCLTK